MRISIIICYFQYRSIRKHENHHMDSLFDSFNESYFGDSRQSEERDLSTDLPHFKGELFIEGIILLMRACFL